MDDPNNDFLSTDELTGKIRSMRALARSLVYGEEAEDVVQDACVIELTQDSVRRDGWFAGVVRNLAMKTGRTAERRRRRETSSVSQESPPSPRELAEQLELQQAITAAVMALDEPYREIVILRFWHDMLPAAIAARRHVSVHTVKTQLQRALSKLRGRLDDTRGRKEWIALLVPWVDPGRVPLEAVVGVKSLTLLVMLMLSVIAGCLVFSLGFLSTDRGADAVRFVSDPNLPSTSVVHTVVDTPAAERSRVATAVPVVTGSLLIRVRHDDGSSAIGIGVWLYRPGDSLPTLSPIASRTDASGLANVTNLSAGRIIIATDRRTRHTATIVAGAVAQLEIELPSGLDLSGRVVDSNGAAVAGARIELANSMSEGARVVAHTGGDGSFAVRDAPRMCSIGARADAHAPSVRQAIHGTPGEAIELKFKLTGVGGAMQGRVRNSAGNPVVGALVLVGTRFTYTSWNDPDNLIGVHSDGDGRFSLTGLPLGELPINVRSPGLAPWTGVVTIAAKAEAIVDLTLEAGVVYSGTVRDAAGAAIEGAAVTCGMMRSINYYHTRTGADGTYRLEGVPPGKVELTLSTKSSGMARVNLTSANGARATWDPSLTLRRQLRIVVRTATGVPIPGVMVTVAGPGKKGSGNSIAGFFVHGETDAAGLFVAKGCPYAAKLGLQFQKRGYLPQQVLVSDPNAIDFKIQLDSANPTVRIIGTIVDSTGKPVANARIAPTRRGTLILRPATAKTGKIDFKVTPGTYVLTIEANGFDRLQTAERTLQSHETWDLGTLQMKPVQGGK